MKNFKKQLLKLTLISLVTMCPSLWAQSYEIIVNPLNQMQPLSKAVLRQLFLKQRTIRGYQLNAADNKEEFNLQPIDNQSDNTYEGFYLTLMGWGLSQINTYWNDKRFSGSSLTPQLLESTSQVIRYVATHKNAISYIPVEDDSNEIRALQVITS
ncbi:hypothetical protein [Piscirickettsia litoralis]|uniref:Uncharacterized protein n=1 Tax=Piscirickettsia litoralis TaxID=1891921 RepID=A0ABX2ZYS6_9GAMM|nr:hypothetical protein [Piscirickettsia litoralis]ODN41772.1 hypothetical protein BGC07_00720 [Piscirickettsia litoralis]